MESGGLFLVSGHQSYIKKSMPKLSNSQLWLLWCFGGPKHELALCVLWMTFTLSWLSQGSDAHKSIWKCVFQRPPNLGRPHFHLSPSFPTFNWGEALGRILTCSAGEGANCGWARNHERNYDMDSFHWSGSPLFLGVDTNYGAAKV